MKFKSILYWKSRLLSLCCNNILDDSVNESLIYLFLSLLSILEVIEF